MFEESALASLIETATGYNTGLADESTLHQLYQTLYETIVDPPGVTLKPEVQVGHLFIKVHGLNVDEMYFDSFAELENEQMLVTGVQFICRRQDFLIVRQNIFNACSGYTPFPGDGHYSSLGFLEGATVACSGKKIWWRDLWGLVFPRIS